MSVKISVYIATSLDGFIARKNGDIDWLPAPDNSAEDYGYKEFISSVDLIVMGRNTHEKVLTFETWPYPDKKVNVLNLSPRDLINILTDKGIRHIYLDGGKTIQRFLMEGLVDEITITTIPVLIGDGLSLFGPLLKDLKFRLLGSNHFNNGFVQSKYWAVKNIS